MRERTITNVRRSITKGNPDELGAKVRDGIERKRRRCDPTYLGVAEQTADVEGGGGEGDHSDGLLSRGRHLCICVGACGGIWGRR